MPDKPNLPLQVLELPPHISDGQGSNPGGGDYVQNDQFWLDKLGERWAEEKELPATHTYTFRRLPQGFSGWERTRSGSTHTDRYMYGHTKRTFRSVNEFLPHFLALMDNNPCPCGPCNSGRGIAIRNANRQTSSTRGDPLTHTKDARVAKRSTSPKKKRPSSSKRSSSSSASHTPQPEVRAPQVDEDGTQDVYRKLCDKLHAAAPYKYETPITEPASPDWVTTHQGIDEEIAKWKSLPSFVPRRGEIVLFVRGLLDDQFIRWDAQIKTFRAATNQRGSANFVGELNWEAGQITQEPLQQLSIEDLTSFTEDQPNVNQSGFRVQPLAALGDPDKSLEKKYAYVPLCAIRPFWMWKECVLGNENQWDPTIRNALSMTASVSVAGRYYFSGLWPNARVFNKIMHIGAEVVVPGDIVRIMPKNFGSTGAVVTDIMEVAYIRLELVDMDEASNDDQDEGPAWKTALHVYGNRYTRINPSHPDKKAIMAGQAPGITPDILDYGPWYKCNGPEGELAHIPFQFILGRCYNRNVIKTLYSSTAPRSSSFISVNDPTVSNTTEAEDLSRGFMAVVEGRNLSKKTHPHIKQELGKNWYFADTRQEALDYDEINGIRVAKDDISRMEEYAEARNALKAINGDQAAIDTSQVQERSKLAKAAGSSHGIAAGAAAIEAEAALSAPMKGLDEADTMELDNTTPENALDLTDSDVDDPMQEVPGTAPNAGAGNLDDDSDEDLEAEEGAANLMKNMRQ